MKLLSIFLLTIAFVFSNQKKDNIKNMKIWLLTDKLSLTEQQAQKFFPMYKIHEKNINENKQLIKKLYQEINKLDSNSKKDFEDLKSKLFTSFINKKPVIKNNIIAFVDLESIETNGVGNCIPCIQLSVVKIKYELFKN